MTKKDDNNEEKMNYYAMKIDDLDTQMKDDARMLQWSIYELNERADVLKTNYAKHEQKCMAKIGEKNMNEEETKDFREKVKAVDELYIELKAKLQQRIDYLKANPIEAQSAEPSCSHQVAEAAQVKQALSVEYETRFAGSMNDWFQFHDEMKSKIYDNANLSDEAKMIELSKVCTPEVMNALKANSFADAWQKLINGYNDKLRLAQFYINKLTNLSPMKSSTANDIDELLAEIDSIEKAFERIGGIDKETLMLVSIMQALDSETMRSWKRYKNVLAVSYAQTNKSDTSEFRPSLNTLIKFLQDEREFYFEDMIEAQSFQSKCQIDEKATPKEQFKPQSELKNKSTGAIPKVKPASYAEIAALPEVNATKCPCRLCTHARLFHPLFKCPKFVDMNFEERVKLVGDFGLCVKCFRLEHRGDCTDKQSNKPCERCKPRIVYHNSTICENNPFIAHASKGANNQANARNNDEWSE